MRNGLVVRLKTLSPGGLALVTTLAKSRHLEQEELTRVVRRRSPLARTILELKDKGFLVPLLGDYNETVFWLPSGMSGSIDAALGRVASVPPEVQQAVNDELRRVGYRHPR